MRRLDGESSIRGFDLGDFRAFERQIANQTLFTEDKSEDWLSQSGGVVLATRPFGHHSDGRIPSGRPSFALGEVIERALSHKQDDFPVRRHTQREPNRAGRDAVVIDRLALDAQHPFTVLAADAKAALGHVPKDQDAERFADLLPVAGVQRIEVLQGTIRAPVNLRLRMSQGGRAYEKTDNRQSRRGRE